MLAVNHVAAVLLSLAVAAALRIPSSSTSVPLATIHRSPRERSSRKGKVSVPLACVRAAQVKCATPETSEVLTTEELKRALISSARAFKDAQEAQWDAEAALPVVEGGRPSVSPQVDERFSSPLKAEGFGNVELGYDAVLGRLRNETVALIEELATRNPTPRPFVGWRSTEEACALDGTWRLLFTTGADATFRKTNATGRAVTFQRIEARKGLFINSVDFPTSTGRLRGFRVVVRGVRLSDSEVSLKFRRVKLLRRARLSLLRTLVIPLPPSWLLRAIARLASRGKGQLSTRGAGFQMLYLDESLRCHITFDGQYFVQQRCRYRYK